MTVDLMEALRYSGAGPHPDEALVKQMERLAAQTAQTVHPRAVWKAYPLERRDGTLFLGEIALPGKTAETMLAECDRAAVMAVTAGSVMDALIREAQVRHMQEALLLDGLGSALAEAKCDETESEIRAAFPALYLTDRFSPGYGDLPLETQRALLACTDAARRIGVTLTESLMMNPFKSVTAIIGLSDRKQRARIRGCAYCALRENCMLRKGGSRCDG